MILSLRRKLTIIPLLLYWPAIFILSHIPIPRLVRRAGVSDKTLHFLVFLILSFLLWFAVSPDRKVNWRRAAVWWVFFIMAGYGAVDEWLQGYVGRNADIMDFSFDIAGLLTGLILFSFFTFWPAFLVVTGIAIFLLTNLTRVNPADLLPITNTLFHLSAYAIFTILWIQYTHQLLMKTPRLKGLIVILALPTGLLLVVKLFSVLFGRYFNVRDVIISALAIAAATIMYYTTLLFRYKISGETCVLSDDKK